MKWMTLLIIILISFKVTSQNFKKFNQISVESGLSQSTVQCIKQDKFGFIWVGTMDGLNRYDGSNFTIYRSNFLNEFSLPSNNIKNLFEDQHQNLWISTIGNLSVYNVDRDDFVNYKIKDLNGNWIENFEVFKLESINDTTFLLASNIGLVRFNLKNSKLFYNNQFETFRNSTVKEYFSFEPIIRDNPNCVITLKEIYKYNAKKRIWEVLFRSENSIYVTKLDAYNLLVQAKHKLFILNYYSGFIRIIDDFPTDFDNDIEDFAHITLQNGETWVYRRGIRVYDSMFKFKYKLVTSQINQANLPFNPIITVYETKSKTIWIGTNAFGLYKYLPERDVFNYIGNHQSSPVALSNSVIWDVFSKDDKLIYLLTLNSLSIINLVNKSVKEELLIGRDKLITYGNKLFNSGSGDIWICTKKGLMVYKNGKISHVDNEILSDPTLNIFDYLQLADDIFLLTTNKGILKWNSKTSETEKISYIISKPIGKFKGKIWVDAGSKIVRFDELTLTKTDSILKGSSGKFPNSPIKCFYTDKKGRFWIGTWGSGLIQYLDNVDFFKPFGLPNGFRNLVIYSIIEDDKGLFWISTNSGIELFDPNLQRVFRNFDSEDGIQGNEFNTRAGHITNNNIIYFGGINGLTYFNPDSVKLLEFKTPKLLITKIYLDDKLHLSNYSDSKSLNSEVVIPYGVKSITINVATLSLRTPNKILLDYKLDLVNPNWIPLEKARTITLSNLPFGHSKIKIRARNRNEIFVENIIEIPIYVSSPFWLKPIFWCLVFLILILLFYGIYKFRTNSIKLKNKVLRKLVEERTNELMEVNSEIVTQNELLNRQAIELDNRRIELESIKNKQEEIINVRTAEIRVINDNLIEQNYQLEQFAFIASHNIRGPVARIKGLINLIQFDTPEIIHLRKSVDQLEEVILDLTFVLNLKQDSYRKRSRISLLKVLNDVKLKLSVEINNSGLLLDTLNFDDVYIDSHKDYLESIFKNIISNAIKFKHNNRIPFLVCSCLIEGNSVIIQFTDNGIGIDMRYAEAKVFNLYQRFHTDLSGKGFGLYLVKNQVDLLLGNIYLDSKVNIGTTITIVLPIISENSTQ